jgi:hypothetical protein
MNPLAESLLLPVSTVRRLLGVGREAEVPFPKVVVVARAMVARRAVAAWLIENKLAEDEVEALAQIRAHEAAGDGPGRRRARRRSKLDKGAVQRLLAENSPD